MSRFNRKQTLSIVSAIVFLTILVVIPFFYIWKRQLDDHQRAVNFLREAEELNHRLNEAVLEAHSFMQEDYDFMTKMSTGEQEFCLSLQRPASEFMFQNVPAVSVAVQDYCRKVEIRTQALENFKSRNSVLRNSLRYYPNLLRGLESLYYKAEALEIFSDVLRYCLQPTQTLENHIHGHLDGLLKKSRVSDQKTARIFNNLYRHAVLIIDTAKQRRDSEVLVLSGGVDMAVDRLRGAYMAEYGRQEQSSKWARLAVIGVCGFLVVGLLLLFARLQETSEKLAELNQNLELKVETRTHELREAMLKLEEQQQILTQSAKMSALGEMAGGVAHEINTPLAAILLTAEQISLNPDLADKPTVQSALEDIARIVERISKIVVGLRRFARNGGNEPFRDVTVKEVVDDTLAFCSEKFRTNGVRLDVQIDPALKIHCASEQISQVILNLLNNAYDAVSNLPLKWVRVESGLRDGRVWIRVVDSGNGIPEDLQKKLMQPFFTTKEVGKGTGLGLSISRGIIDSHRGEFGYRPEASNTTFEIVLPAPSDPTVLAA